MKTIALVGRPNVGKSSLFNVLTNSRDALVADIPGLTRDRHYAKLKINNSFFILIDTGGMERSTNSGIKLKMIEQTNLAIDESEIIFFIVDGRQGLHPFDEDIAKNLRKKNKSILLLINKCENLNIDLVENEFNKLGFLNKIFISTSHRSGISLINDFLVQFTGKSSDNLITDKKISISILGKPNVGKSTLINSILGEERFISFDEPGTTRDSVSTDFIYNGKHLSIIDTAGIRKKGRVADTVEKFSILKSLLSINKSNVTILVINADEGLGTQDLQILGYILESGKPLVISVNKWDLLDSYKKNEFKKQIQKRMNFFKNYQIFYISALKKIGINELLSGVFNAYNVSRIKIKTPILNKFISDLQITHQPPIFKGIRPKLKYAHQGDIMPPTIVIHGNHLSGLKKDYIKFIESSLINTFNLLGTPIRIQLNETNNPYDQNPKRKRVTKTGLVTRRKDINKKREMLKRKKES